MTLTETLNKLESLGNVQIKKIYKQQGANDNTYGVSIENIINLSKDIKSPEGRKGKNHNLAIQLWKSGNTEARIIATLLIEPEKLTDNIIDRCISEIDYYVIADYFAQCIYDSDYRMEKMLEWTQCEIEYIKRTGFTILNILAKEDKVSVDTIFIPYIKQIEYEMATSANMAKESMSFALKTMGSRNENLKSIAHEAAAKIGIVEIKYGDKIKSYNPIQELDKVAF